MSAVINIRDYMALTGNEAIAHGLRQINPDVIAAYPITPATEIVQLYANFVADGLVDTELVTVESEHSAMSATIGASAAGARAMTATSSQGFALMWEMLYIAAGLRLPIVMPVVNRALSAPINIHCDHSDTMGARDAGWIQIFAENAQEAYDSLIQAARIAEHPDVLLPVMVNMDGFIISHAMEPVEVYDDAKVKAFVGQYRPAHPLLDIEHPVTVGALSLQDSYFELRRSLAEPMFHARKYILEVAAEFTREFGRGYGLFEAYRLEDAEYAVVVLGSTAGTAKMVVDELREKGMKAGLLKLRVFRPFPAEELVDALKGLKAVAVMDRSDGLSAQGGQVACEVKAAFYEEPVRPMMINYIYGLGGRDVTLDHIRQVYGDLQEAVAAGRVAGRLRYLGVRE